MFLYHRAADSGSTTIAQTSKGSSPYATYQGINYQLYNANIINQRKALIVCLFIKIIIQRCVQY